MTDSDNSGGSAGHGQDGDAGAHEQNREPQGTEEQVDGEGDGEKRVRKNT